MFLEYTSIPVYPAAALRADSDAFPLKELGGYTQIFRASRGSVVTLKELGGYTLIFEIFRREGGRDGKVGYNC